MTNVDRTVNVTITKTNSGISWIFTSDGDSGNMLHKKHVGDITYKLTNSPGYTFCEKPDIDTDPDNQLVDPTYSAHTAKVLDLYTAWGPQTTSSIYLYVQDQEGNVFQSPDPEVENTGNSDPGGH